MERAIEISEYMYYVISFTEPALPLSSGTGNVARPVSLDKGNAGSGDEIEHCDNSFITHARIHELKMRF